MLEIDVYRCRIGSYLPRFSYKKTYKEMFRLKSGLSFGLICIFILAQVLVLTNQEKSLQISGSCSGVYNLPKLIQNLNKNTQPYIFVTVGHHQTWNFIARMINGNKAHGIINMQINIRSLFNKLSEIKMLVKKENPHILGVTEAELSKNLHNVNTLKLPGYDILLPKSWNVTGRARV